MKVTIIKDDNTVGIDGQFVSLDLSGLPETLRVIQWNGQRGWVEYRDRENERLDSIAQYQGIIDIANDMIANPFYGLTLEQKQNLARHRISAECDARKLGGIQVAGVWYPSDFESMFQYLDWKDAGRDMLASGATVDSILLIDDNPAKLDGLDGLEYDITIKTCGNLVDKCRRLIRKLKRVKKNHITAMMAAPDPLAYDYYTNWPERYTGA